MLLHFEEKKNSVGPERCDEGAFPAKSLADSSIVDAEWASPD